MDRPPITYPTAPARRAAAGPLDRLLDTRRPLRWLTLLCALLWLPGFFALPPGDRDESRFAQASRQMVESGDWVRIRFRDEERNKKPVGIHWLQAGAVRALSAAGVPDAPARIWAYRLPSLLGAWPAASASSCWLCKAPRAALPSSIHSTG